MKKVIFILCLLVIAISGYNQTGKKQENFGNIYERLFDAIGKNDTKTFDILLADIPNIDSLVYISDSTHSMGYTLLGYACRHNRCGFVDKLLKQKADVNRGQENEYYAYDALFLAIAAFDECIVELLLAAGANPNVIYNEYGTTLLTFSAQYEQCNLISKMLIDKGADINGAGDLGFEGEAIYPLFEALYNNNLEMARYLIEKGCQLNIYTINELTPLDWAQENNKEMAEFILQYLEKNYSYHVNENWLGSYEYETSPFTDGLMTIPRVYTLEIMPDSCVFSGIGHQLYFVEKCTIEETAPDVLIISFYQLLDGRSSHYKESYTLKLLRNKNKYYFNSPYIFKDEESNIDVEVVRIN